MLTEDQELEIARREGIAFGILILVLFSFFAVAGAAFTMLMH
jgi:hypothetical protein